MTIPNANFILPAGAGQHTIDVMGEGSDTENEQLFAYDLGLQLTKTNGDNGTTFATPYATKPADNFVFNTQPTDFGVVETSANRFIVNVVNNGTLVDVPQGTPMKLATITLNVDPTSTGGTYKISLIPDRTDFASGDPNRADPTIAQDISNANGGTVTVVIPEPASLSLVAIGGLLALRRRRTA